jgi:type II restriction/modification system DNA methylase subunit YeeA
MNILEFQAKWRHQALGSNERQTAQSFFNDRCGVFEAPAPNDDPSGDYVFEKHVPKLTGGMGFADVWRRGWWAWEFKKPGENLAKAYGQLKAYADALENPPLLILCDLTRITIYTNFTGTATATHELTLDTIDHAASIMLLRAVFHEPHTLKPGASPAEVTEQAAARFGTLAAGLYARGVEPRRAAHYLVQLVFCLFAEDVGLLPRGLFSDLLALGVKRPDAFPPQATALLTAMRDGGYFGAQVIPRFNGGLFAEVNIEPLTAAELAELHSASKLNWGSVEPTIFGTLFERSLDPAKRSQLGAHYTGPQEIERVVEPVVMTPLRRRWEAVKAQAAKAKAAWAAATTPQTRANRRQEFIAILNGFKNELASVTVLDPACGSSNFLYMTLAKLLDLEKEVIAYGAANGLPLGYPLVGPAQLAGLEINEYARELAQAVIWIGYLQWMLTNGFLGSEEPILKPLETIRLQDALLDRTDPEHPKEATWPKADFIIGNPPFLGGKRLRTELGDSYIRDLFAVYDGSVAREADLVCYFFENARLRIAEGEAKRAGLLATNSIRGGANREVLKRIKETGDIFFAWDDEPWILDGAAVRISIVGFDNGNETSRALDGRTVANINPDLTSAADITSAKPLRENNSIGFMGDTKGGPFDIPGDTARRWLALPSNPNGRPNSDVVLRWVNGLDVTRRPRDMWIIDFGVDMPEHEAAIYEQPFEYVRLHVRPMRDKNNREAYRERWWLHVEARQGMRNALDGLTRFVSTPTVAKHRLFVWNSGNTLPDHQLIVFARQDDYFFGVLHSRAHEVWSLRMGTWLGVGNDPRYTPTTCFETFPLPWTPGQEPWRDERLHAIAQAAQALDEARNAWLNPPDATEEVLKKRTLTNLYNERPTWLANLHAALDRTVWDAYGWDDADPSAVPEDEVLARLLALNLERAGK